MSVGREDAVLASQVATSAVCVIQVSAASTVTRVCNDLTLFARSSVAARKHSGEMSARYWYFSSPTFLKDSILDTDLFVQHCYFPSLSAARSVVVHYIVIWIHFRIRCSTTCLSSQWPLKQSGRGAITLSERMDQTVRAFDLKPSWTPVYSQIVVDWLQTLKKLCNVTE